MIEGNKFRRKKLTFGFATGSEDITLKLSINAEIALKWTGDNGSSGEIPIETIKSVEAKLPSSIVITSKAGDLLLEIEARDEDVQSLWVTALHEILLDESKGAPSPLGKPASMKQRAAKQVYFSKKNIELAEKRKAAEQRKSKYMKDSGGLQYTALAMANRS